MLKRSNRLSPQIRFAHAAVFHTKFFTVKIEKNNLLENKYGFIVTKKIDKKAVVRNKVKRRVRACIEELERSQNTRLHLPAQSIGGQEFGMTLKKGYNMIFFVKKEAVAATAEEISQVIEDIFKKETILI